jgi:UDP-glucuronate 4-epimerase
MSLFLFVNAILNKEPINVFNDGKMRRDFTYIDDIVEGVLRVLDKPATSEKNFDGQKPLPHIGCAPYRIFNIGNSNPVPLMDFIEAIENSLGMTAKKIFLPLQAGDVAETYADIDELDAWVGFKPATKVKDGIGRFIDWYLDYYQIKLPQKNENSHSN